MYYFLSFLSIIWSLGLFLVSFVRCIIYLLSVCLLSQQFHVKSMNISSYACVSQVASVSCVLYVAFIVYLLCISCVSPSWLVCTSACQYLLLSGLSTVYIAVLTCLALTFSVFFFVHSRCLFFHLVPCPLHILSVYTLSVVYLLICLSLGLPSRSYMFVSCLI